MKRKEDINVKRFSIIMPCYNITNSENYIHYLAKQSFKNFELICINDCSTDSTLTVLESLSSSFSNLFDFKIIDLDSNVGPGEARNIGIANCQGEFIVFLDSDDYLSDNCLETINNVIALDNSIDCIIFDFQVCKGSTKRERFTFKKSGLIDLFDSFIFTPNGISGKCLKKEMLTNHNIKFLHLKRCEDYPFFRHVYLVSNKIYYIREPLYNYVMNDASLMHRNDLIDVNNATSAFDYLKTKTSDTKLLGIAFMKNCLYSNALAMLEKHVGHKVFKDRIRFLRNEYKDYCRLSNLKPYSFKIKIISVLALLNWYYVLKFAYTFYEKRVKI